MSVLHQEEAQEEEGQQFATANLTHNHCKAQSRKDLADCGQASGNKCRHVLQNRAYHIRTIEVDDRNGDDGQRQINQRCPKSQDTDHVSITLLSIGISLVNQSGGAHFKGIDDQSAQYSEGKRHGNGHLGRQTGGQCDGDSNTSSQGLVHNEDAAETALDAQINNLQERTDDHSLRHVTHNQTNRQCQNHRAAVNTDAEGVADVGSTIPVEYADQQCLHETHNIFPLNYLFGRIFIRLVRPASHLNTGNYLTRSFSFTGLSAGRG